MSRDIAISAEQLSKSYRLGERDRHLTLREALRHWAIAPFRRLGSASPPAENAGQQANQPEILWALRDISFQVPRGEVLGLIGRNGAGKSTLLKILTRITKPTTGRAEIRGRVGSLLEVGTGFHPELTGRENVFLNGAILGMPRAEIRRKFDEIVAFSGVEPFLDTPVKRYSSGMRVRLAFAVAAHLDPEILLIDEVLAVGDAEFQKKCLGKMSDVARGGRTIVFVSHNMVAMRALCSRVMWLDNGRLVVDGPSETVIPNYLQSTRSETQEREWPDAATAPGNEKVRLRRVSIQPQAGTEEREITMRTPLEISVELDNLVAGAELDVTLVLFTDEEVIAFTTSSVHTHRGIAQASSGRYRATCLVPGSLLNQGTYSIRVVVLHSQGIKVYEHPELFSFEVHDDAASRGTWFGRRPGVVQPFLEWQLEACPREREGT